MGARGIIGRAVVSAAVALALGATGALAATVYVRSEGVNKGPSRYYAQFESRQGERNDLTITRDTARGPTFDDVTFADAGAPVVARAGCAQVSTHEAFCDRGAIVVTLGDLDDHALARAFAHVAGGEGADLLQGAGSFDGGPGDDVIRGDDTDGNGGGGPGFDQISMGGGDDRIAADPDGVSELLDGGGGRDEVDYSSTRMTVDLVADRAGIRGDEDRLASIEDATIGGGTLRGDNGPNRLDANAGSTLLGRGGDDELLGGGSGRDVADGGAGDDRIDLFSSDAPERLRCGPGSDTVGHPGPKLLLPVDCERVTYFGAAGPDVMLPGTGGARGGLAEIRYIGRCAQDSTVKSCRVKAAVSEAVWPDRRKRPKSGRALGKATGTISRERPRLTVTPGRYGRAVLASGRCVTVRLKMTGVGRDGDLEMLYRLGRRCKPPAPVEP